MRLQRAVCPVRHYIASAWAGWTIVSTETVLHTPGVYARGGDRSGGKGPSSGDPVAIYHLSRPWK